MEFNIIADGREVEEEMEQNLAHKVWFSHTHESEIQQVHTIRLIIVTANFSLLINV